MLIDCATCVARDIACRDCVITALLDRPVPAVEPIDLDDAEHAAIMRLASVGLIPPLRLVSAVPTVERETA